METIFLAYSFHRHEEKVFKAVKGILEGHGLTVVTGQHLTGEQLTEEVTTKIEGTDGLVAILSPRKKGNAPSDWVMQELTWARGKEMRTVALAHNKVRLGGPAAAYANIKYDPSDLVDALVGLTHTVVQWKQEAGTVLRMEVLPQQLAKRLGSPPPDEIDFRLSPRRKKWGDWLRASVDSGRSQAFIDVPVCQDAAHVQLRANVDGKLWRSDSTPLCLPVRLRKR